MAIELLGSAALPSKPVDRLVPRGGRDPGARVVGYAPLGPDLDGGYERLLNRVLGEVEVTEHADQRGRRASGFGPEDAVDELWLGLGQAVAGSTMFPASS